MEAGSSVCVVQNRSALACMWSVATHMTPMTPFEAQCQVCLFAYVFYKGKVKASLIPALQIYSGPCGPVRYEMWVVHQPLAQY